MPVLCTDIFIAIVIMYPSMKNSMAVFITTCTGEGKQGKKVCACTLLVNQPPVKFMSLCKFFYDQLSIQFTMMIGKPCILVCSNLRD